MIIADDSLVCFPMRYLSFIREDLEKGDENEKKVSELTESYSKQESENIKLKQKFQLQMEECSTYRDSLEMKNARIELYSNQYYRTKKKNMFLTGLIVVLSGLFLIK